LICGCRKGAEAFGRIEEARAESGFYILDGHQRVSEVLMVSKVTWDKLSDEDRKIIQQAAQDSVKFQKAAWDKFEKDALAKLIQGGVIVTEVKDVTPWKAAVKSVIEKYGVEYKAELEASAKSAK